ncbi:hypothetical protein B0H65DRAFT_570919 [Neurospora tetraspora]|uniref:Uncharacterized protein n=1 Tax=Neurospora tetraspora TaxID=94610 RepID=A0AAE0JH52_9PEZI|nr:hypothetical protein B0H65DRAFT_570919 [Neurospora tetraspora]
MPAISKTLRARVIAVVEDLFAAMFIIIVGSCLSFYHLIAASNTIKSSRATARTINGSNTRSSSANTGSSTITSSSNNFSSNSQSTSNSNGNNSQSTTSSSGNSNNIKPTGKKVRFALEERVKLGKAARMGESQWNMIRRRDRREGAMFAIRVPQVE